MESGSTAGIVPAAAFGDTGVLDIAEDDGYFENVLDEPFITVNIIDGRMVAEIVKSPNPVVTNERIQQAVDIGHTRGHHSWAAVHGDYADVGYDVVTIHFMPDGDL